MKTTTKDTNTETSSSTQSRPTTSGIDLPPKKPGSLRALALMSGGLDSSIAITMMREQGIEVVGINFYTGFCVTEQKARMGRSNAHGKEAISDARQAAVAMDLPMDIVDISQDYLPMVTQPKYGYGKNVNPCIDCRIFMLKEAKKLLDVYDADFIITGEVVGQRPKSQRLQTQRLIEKQSGLEGKLIRPLSAHHHAPTEFEEDGRINRDALGQIYGRSRKEQYKFAEEHGLENYASPAGGCCFLADEHYAKKFKDMITDQLEQDPDVAPNLDMEDVVLMGMGRHFRIRTGLKLIVGRNADENKALELYRNRRWFYFSDLVKGPLALVECKNPEGINETEWEFMASIIATYGQGRDLDDMELVLSPPLRSLGREEREMFARYPGDESNLYDWQRLMIVQPLPLKKAQEYLLTRRE